VCLILARSAISGNEPVAQRLTLDALPVYASVGTQFPPEKDPSVYGHGLTVIRSMRHFQ
jgi:hypothetical protein